MTQKSWPWSTAAGLGDGSADLGESDSRAMLALYFGVQDPTEEGVSKGVLNELEITGAASPLQADTGSAICYGLYFNDAAVNLTVSTPALGTTGGRVVLQTNWAGTGGGALEARTRLAVVMNSDGVAAIPALTQTPGTTWEISLATFTITTGGVINLTDDRTFRKSTMVVGETELEAAVVAQLVTNGDSHDHFGGDGAAIVAGGLANGAVDTTARLADNIVDDTKVGGRVAQFYRRQGGHATIWSTAGASNYDPGALRVQFGVAQVALAASPAGILAVTFPTAFSQAPAGVHLTHVLYTRELDVSYSSLTAIGFQLNVDVIDGTSVTTNISVAWMAIGPE